MSQINLDVFLKNELLDCFGNAIENSPEILAECLSILKIYSISPTELFYRWESWCLKMGNEPELVLENIQLFKKDMQYMLEKRSSLKKKQSDYNNIDYSADLARRDSKSCKLFSNIISNNFEDSEKLSSFLDSSCNSDISIENNNYISISSFNFSTNSQKIVETLNSHISFCNIRNDIDEKQKKISLVVNFDPKKYSFKIMYQKLSEVSEVLDDKIDMFTDELIKHYDLSQDDFGNPAHISHVLAVGRIICDSDSGGRLSTTSIILETSRRFGAGSRVLLHVDNLRSYALFPGQVLGVKGINSSGSYFSVREFLMLPLLPFSATSLLDFQKYNSLLNGMPQKIFIASGPYTINDNILFEPLTELCNKIQQEKPDVAIFIGPFLDIRHPLISSGNFDIASLKDDIGSLDDLFKHCISSKLMRLNCLVIMIPHVQDACCRHAAWPQDCFNKKSLGLGKNIKCMPNPALFSLNEVIIGISSNDILMSSPLYSNTLARLSYHVIQQRHFYPLFPGTAYESFIDGANLDIAFMGLGEFSDVVSGTVVVNPGRLAKKQAFGTYAVMYIEPRNLEKAELIGVDLNDIMLPHNLPERARVDIIRI
ncbi:hypothetical protein PMAC_001526 [Pneumocystis sp. 'macacae']|nr:hypothetical protein PMAC_001526 [Pneumocystis sp. 'macacae']